MLVLAFCAAGAAPTVAGAATAVGNCTPGSDWPAADASLANQVVDLVNQHRSGMGLNTLVVTSSLTNSAVWKARHMAMYRYMQHDDPAPPVGRSPDQRLAACGYVTNSWWGENIAYGYSSAQAVMNGWLNSSGHRANIENTHYKAIGVGAARATNGTLYWAQNFGSDTSGSVGGGGGGGGGGGTTAPTVNLSGTPASSTTSTSASFSWSTTGSPTSTTCKLDSGTASSCSSPKSYSGLAVGSHTFQVQVSNSAGSASATYSWTITSSSGGGGGGGTPTGVPGLSLTSGPAGYTSVRSATFVWTTTGTVTSTTCSLDSQAAAACSSPKTYTGLTSGWHRFKLTVANSAGSRTLTYSWYIL